VEPKVTIDSNKCIHCGRCSEINEKGCLLAKSKISQKETLKTHQI
jgi:formate hydrogenlyase subunit 6/NADH:ubiquinone oxidoreductase subunit I